MIGIRESFFFHFFKVCVYYFRTINLFSDEVLAETSSHNDLIISFCERAFVWLSEIRLFDFSYTDYN